MEWLDEKSIEYLKFELRSLIFSYTRNFAQKQGEKFARAFFESAEDIIVQTIALWILDWAHKEDNPLSKTGNAAFEELYTKAKSNGSNQLGSYDSELRHFQRVNKRLRRINNQFRENQKQKGISAPDPIIAQSKHKGIPLSPLNAKILYNHTRNIALSTLLDKIWGKQIINADSVSNRQFAMLFESYEAYHSTLIQTSTDDEYLINSLDFFALQEKFHLDLIAKIAAYMKEHKHKEYPVDRGYYFWNTIIDPHGNPLEANQILTYDQAIPIVFDSEQKTFELEAELWLAKRRVQAILLNYLKDCGYSILTVEKAATFFKNDYNVLENHEETNFGSEASPDTRKIHCARVVMRSIYD